MTDRERGMVESHENEESQRSEVQSTDARNVTEYGNSILLQESLKDLKPLLRGAFLEIGKKFTLYQNRQSLETFR